MAVQSKDPALIQQLSALLEGEPGGAGPDTGNLLLLKMALGHFDEAAELAVGLARQDQEAGNYKVSYSAHWACSRLLSSQLGVGLAVSGQGAAARDFQVHAQQLIHCKC